MVKLKCITNMERLFPKMTKYPRGIIIKKGMEIEVTEKEAAGLLTMKNGSTQFCFEEIKKREPKIIEQEE